MNSSRSGDDFFSFQICRVTFIIAQVSKSAPPPAVHDERGKASFHFDSSILKSRFSKNSPTFTSYHVFFKVVLQYTLCNAHRAITLIRSTKFSRPRQEEAYKIPSPQAHSLNTVWSCHIRIRDGLFKVFLSASTSINCF